MHAMTDSASLLPRFAAIVCAEPALAAELRRAGDHEAFVALVIARAQERGLAIGADEVAAALGAAKHAWMLQWPTR
jgi:hypothetical protein